MKFTFSPSTTKLNFLLVACLGMILLLAPACEKDIDGCTDANAENYNAEATTDDGTCVLAREKFLGAYNVNENCQTGNFSYSITISASGTDEAAVVINNFGDYGANVRATVSGATLSFNDTQGGISFSGSADLGGNTLTIIYTASNGILTDSCTKTCIKQ